MPSRLLVVEGQFWWARFCPLLSTTCSQSHDGCPQGYLMLIEEYDFKLRLIQHDIVIVVTECPDRLHAFYISGSARDL